MLRKAGLFVDYIDEHVVFVSKTTCSAWCREHRLCTVDWCVDARTEGWRLRARVLSSRDAAGEFYRWLVNFVHRSCARTWKLCGVFVWSMSCVSARVSVAVSLGLA